MRSFMLHLVMAPPIFPSLQFVHCWHAWIFYSFSRGCFLAVRQFFFMMFQGEELFLKEERGKCSQTSIENAFSPGIEAPGSV